MIQYEKIQPVFEHVAGVLADLGDYMAENLK